MTKTNRFLHLATPSVQKIAPYIPGKPMEELQRELGLTHITKLASNENPLGPSPKAMQAIERFLPDLARYPDSNGYLLKQALAAHYQVDETKITLGNGSDSLFTLIAQTFAGPEGEIIISQYAFALYLIAAQIAQATPIIVPAKDWQHDLDAIALSVSASTKVIFLANPNNPTGTWFNHATFMTFIESIPKHVLVVLDEAYYEYMIGVDYPKTLPLIDEFPNLIITRTFSKIFGLAGLRLGYAFAHPDITELLNRTRPPFNVSSIAQVAGRAAIEDSDHIADSLRLNELGRIQLSNALTKLGLGIISSAGNFITFDVHKDTTSLFQALLTEGVIVRPLHNYQMPNHLRVTIGLQSENSRFIQALEKILLY